MKDQTSFKIGCLVIAIISYFLLAYSGRNLKPAVDRGEDKASLSERQEWKGENYLLNPLHSLAIFFIS